MKKEIRKKVYLASGWFSPEQAADEADLFAILHNMDFIVFRPKTDNKINIDMSYTNKRQGFQNNINEIKKCDFVLGNISHRDSGTIFEIGYAYKLNKPIILVDFLRISNKPNLMLAMCANLGLCTNKQTLINELCHLKHIPKYSLSQQHNWYKGETH